MDGGVETIQRHASHWQQFSFLAAGQQPLTQPLAQQLPSAIGSRWLANNAIFLETSLELAESQQPTQYSMKVSSQAIVSLE